MLVLTVTWVPLTPKIEGAGPPAYCSIVYTILSVQDAFDRVHPKGIKFIADPNKIS